MLEGGVPEELVARSFEALVASAVGALEPRAVGDLDSLEGGSEVDVQTKCQGLHGHASPPFAHLGACLQGSLVEKGPDGDLEVGGKVLPSVKRALYSHGRQALDLRVNWLAMVRQRRTGLRHGAHGHDETARLRSGRCAELKECFHVDMVVLAGAACRRLELWRGSGPLDCSHVNRPQSTFRLGPTRVGLKSV